MKKTISVYLFEDRIVFYSSSKVKGGPTFATEPIVVLPYEVAPENLFESMNYCFNSNKLNIENMSDIDFDRKVFLKNLKVKSSKELHRKAKSGLLDIKDDILTLTPGKLNGLDYGYIDKINEAESIPFNADISIIAQKFKEMIEKCE